MKEQTPDRHPDTRAADKGKAEDCLDINGWRLENPRLEIGQKTKDFLNSAGFRLHESTRALIGN